MNRKRDIIEIVDSDSETDEEVLLQPQKRSRVTSDSGWITKRTKSPVKNVSSAIKKRRKFVSPPYGTIAFPPRKTKQFQQMPDEEYGYESSADPSIEMAKQRRKQKKVTRSDILTPSRRMERYSMAEEDDKFIKYINVQSMLSQNDARARDIKSEIKDLILVDLEDMHDDFHHFRYYADQYDIMLDAFYPEQNLSFFDAFTNNDMILAQFMDENVLQNFGQLSIQEIETRIKIYFALKHKIEALKVFINNAINELRVQHELGASVDSPATPPYPLIPIFSGLNADDYAIPADFQQMIDALKKLETEKGDLKKKYRKDEQGSWKKRLQNPETTKFNAKLIV